MKLIDYVKVVRFRIGWLTAMLPIFSTQSFTFSDNNTHMLFLCPNTGVSYHHALIFV